ncbi:class I SAM-dependent DNA methyltransferase [Radiobacillus sp. PE A8.2]|uniref:class I SAM-dependent DNA methyltransferase n=1 Tax=Radiobacillus sp. PE A8.2 TaxID=3380349 RepID=UPI00389029DA
MNQLGREFVDLFDKWATSYDKTVAGHDPQYRAVFENYDQILSEVVYHAEGNVLEFGVGTGNLSKKLLDAGHFVVGVEPSEAMRHATNIKFPDITVHDGDFLTYPTPEIPIFTIVSSYAFHHLTNDEKDKAIAGFYQLLPENGKVVFADTLYENEETKQNLWKQAEENGHMNLLHDLQTEYYPFRSELQKIFENNGFYVTFKQMNDFAWLIVAEKQ